MSENLGERRKVWSVQKATWKKAEREREMDGGGRGKEASEKKARGRGVVNTNLLRHSGGQIVPGAKEKGERLAREEKGEAESKREKRNSDGALFRFLFFRLDKDLK